MDVWVLEALCRAVLRWSQRRCKKLLIWSCG